MIQVTAMHARADAHRRELMQAAESTRAARDLVNRSSGPSATQRSATGLPVAGGRAVRHAWAPRIGAWLIHAGTRMGGTSIRTS